MNPLAEKPKYFNNITDVADDLERRMKCFGTLSDMSKLTKKTGAYKYTD